jgi:hypothetical protein
VIAGGRQSVFSISVETRAGVTRHHLDRAIDALAIVENMQKQTHLPIVITNRATGRVLTVDPHRQIDLSLRRGKPILFGAGALVLHVQIREMRLYFYGIQRLTEKRLRLLGT